MSSPNVTLDERIGNWKRAYDLVLPELVTDEQRALMSATATMEGMEQLASYVALARNIMAGQRTAAMVAAMLTTSGIRPVAWDEGGEL